MDGLHQILSTLIKENPSFGFHPKYAPLNLFQFNFADDLLLCCKGDVNSVLVFKQGLRFFHQFLGLNKYNVFGAGVLNSEKEYIIAALGFKIGVLPMKYLGVALISSKLKAKDY